MKVRHDFVTNSSSSSFILAFQSKEDGLSQIAKMTSQYGSDYVCQLLRDFDEATPIPYEEVAERMDRDFESDAWFDICYGSGGWWSNRKDTFEKRWMDAHPGATSTDFHNSDEFKAELARKKQEYADKMKQRIGNNRYLILLEYEDHTDVGSRLEHEILPNCDFTVRRFSHH